MNVKIKCDLNLKQKQTKNPEGHADLSSTVYKKANWTVSRYLWRLYCVPGSGYDGCCLFSVHILMERWWIKSKQANKTHLIGILACSFYEFFHFPTERTSLSPQVCGFPCRRETLLSQGSGTSSVSPLITMQLLFWLFLLLGEMNKAAGAQWTPELGVSPSGSAETIKRDSPVQSWKLLDRTSPSATWPCSRGVLGLSPVSPWCCGVASVSEYLEKEKDVSLPFPLGEAVGEWGCTFIE